MAYSVCRLCSGVENKEMVKLTPECEILLKIRTCLCMNLKLVPDLPDNLCLKCVNTVENINTFCIKIKETEQLLQNHLQNGTLQQYFSNLHSSYSIKDEDNISMDNCKDEINILTEEHDTSNKNEIKIEENIKNDFDDAINNSTDDEDYATENVFEHHISIVDNKRTVIQDSKKVILDTYSCLTCDKVCVTHEGLKKHYNMDHTEKDIKMKEPTYTKTVINGKVMYKCNDCDKIYSKKYLKRHLLNHTDVRPYVCRLCSRTYTTVSDIMRHGFRVHSGIKMLCAYKCGFSSAYTGALKEHEDRVHKNVYKYMCEKCGKGFQVKTWYDQHQNIHTGLKPYICDICGHAFHMEKYLTNHRGKIHPHCIDAKRLICVRCKLKCENENNLNLHMETEHGVIRKKPDKRKKALCDLCGKILNRPEDLVLHRRMHLGQRPYKCSVCNKSFPRKYSLQVHERSHSRVNSHECTQCGKKYSQQSILNRHQRQQHAMPSKHLKTSDDT